MMFSFIQREIMKPTIESEVESVQPLASAQAFPSFGVSNRKPTIEEKLQKLEKMCNRFCKPEPSTCTSKLCN